MSDEFLEGGAEVNPASFIARGLNEGLSGADILRQLQDEGAGVRRQDFYRLVGETRDALARAGTAGQLDPYAIPNSADYATWSMGPGGEYVTSVRVFFRDQDSGLIGSKLYDYKTAQPHTPAEAMLAAEQDYFSPDNTELGQSGEGQTFMGTTVHNVYLTEPWSR